jgi:hypothetical protein
VIGEPRWAVCCEGGVLNTHNEWEYEPNPSSRSDAFKKRTRFDTIEEAEAAFRRFEERCQPEE